MTITLDDAQTRTFKEGTDEEVLELFALLQFVRRHAVATGQAERGGVNFVTTDGAPVEPNLPPPKRG